mmetsp:Transcript_18199/g.31151  ORF Transcript_18199/g.31151 Transcript_18199/m.31151 type:complete len:165 (-) Transcript_18199:177-671(-)
MKRELKKMEEELEDKSHPFKPQIYSKGGPKHFELDYSHIFEKSVEERNQQWIGKKQQNMERIKERYEREQFQDCTFRPKVSGVSVEALSNILTPDYSKMNTKAIEKFIDRQIVSRLRKMDQVRRHDNYVGNGKHWQNKVTVPKTPKLLKHELSPTSRCLSARLL